MHDALILPSSARGDVERRVGSGKRRPPPRETPDRRSLTEPLEHRVRPFSTGFDVFVFGFFAAGVTSVGGGFGAALTDPAAAGIVVRKAIGVVGRHLRGPPFRRGSARTRSHLD